MTETQKNMALELLQKTEDELYNYYLATIASPFVLAKTERGKKTSYRLWKITLDCTVATGVEA